MKYLEACKIAILDGWSDHLSNDFTSGNCFQILWYGIKSSSQELLFIIVRLFFALLFPLTAILVMRVEKKNKKWERQAKAKAEADLDL